MANKNEHAFEEIEIGKINLTDLADDDLVTIEVGQLRKLLNSKDKAERQDIERNGFVAHESKRHLASIKGYAEVMLMGLTGELSEQQQQFLRVIKVNAEKLQAFIEDTFPENARLGE